MEEQPMLRKNLLGLSLLLSVVLGFATTGSAFAASCKGMEKAKCETTDGCYWVDAYKRKDGVDVSGHCRGKPGAKKGGDDKKETPDDADSGSESTTESESESGNDAD
jgi:hypothetical protein